MIHFIYKTTNEINGKIYVGKRSSNTLDEGYLGSGKLLKLAFRKHGRQNFRREILQFCNSEEEAYLAEGLIVNQDFIAREDTYNLKCGGEGGLRGFHHSEESKEKSRKSNSGLKRSKKFRDKMTGRVISVEHRKNLGKRSSKTRWMMHDEYCTMVKFENIEKYLAEGWIFGRKRGPKFGRKKI